MAHVQYGGAAEPLPLSSGTATLPPQSRTDYLTEHLELSATNLVALTQDIGTLTSKLVGPYDKEEDNDKSAPVRDDPEGSFDRLGIAVDEVKRQVDRATAALRILEEMNL